jgi:hypothetical protein
VNQSEHLKAIQFVGTQRSGSNLLRVMLNQLPEISAPHPPHILKTFFPVLSLYGDLNVDDNFRQLVSDICEWVNRNPVPWEGILFSTEEVLRACKERNLVEIFRRVYELKAVQEGAQYWCCKSMESVYYTDEIESAGVHPYYIYIYRDGRDVALSFLKAIVGPKHIYHLARKWKLEQELSLKLKAAVPANRFIEVRYEELIAHPRVILKELCEKLGVNYNEAMMDYFRSRESANTAASGQMWKNVTMPILSNNHHKYLHELSMEQIRIFEGIAHDMLTALGYPLITDASGFTISEEEIVRYDEENAKGIADALLKANLADVARREAQENLLNEIKNRIFQ